MLCPIVKRAIVQIIVCVMLLQEPVAAELTAASGNVAVVFGSNATFRCNTNNETPIRWQRITDSQIPDILYNGLKVAGRCSFNNCSVATKMPRGHSALTIEEVIASDGGQYQCVDTWGSQSFQLIVLESEPVCSTAPPASGQLTENQELKVACYVNYKGNCSPVIDCVPQMEGEHISTKNDNGIFFYSKLLKIPRDFDGMTIACTTRFSTNCTNTMKDGFPRFTHTWKSDKLNVTVRATHGTGFLVVGIVIGCLAAAVIILIIALTVVLLRRYHASTTVVSGSDQCSSGNHDDSTAPKSIRNSRLGKRISHLYSRIRKREREQNAANAGQQQSNDGLRETINEYGQVYDAVGDKPVPAYDASYSKYVNAPDDSKDCQSIIMELGDETESTNYAEVPE